MMMRGERCWDLLLALLAWRLHTVQARDSDLVPAPARVPPHPHRASCLDCVLLGSWVSKRRARVDTQAFHADEAAKTRFVCEMGGMWDEVVSNPRELSRAGRMGEGNGTGRLRAPPPLQTVNIETRLARQGPLVKCVDLFAAGHQPVEVMIDEPMYGSSRRASELARCTPRAILHSKFHGQRILPADFRLEILVSRSIVER